MNPSLDLLGVPEQQLVRILGDETDPERAACHLLWNIVTEPGDGAAGQVIGALGIEEATAALAGVPSAAVHADELGDAWRTGRRRWSQRLEGVRFRQIVNSAASLNLRFLQPNSKLWPKRLALLEEHAPIGLWVGAAGAPGSAERLDGAELLHSPSVALVGARAATGYGEHVTSVLASGLSDRFTIVSGGAYGIDAMAHRAALAVDGPTVAVLAGGLDLFYPRGNEQLLRRVAERGVVVSEVPPATTPSKWRFLQRNRIIAALALGTVVVEAGARSGALNTANHALELGLPVGAVPGPITSAASMGCHRLIRDGLARCVTSVDEVSELVVGIEAELEPLWQERVDPVVTRMLDAMSAREPRSAATIAASSGLDASSVMVRLGVAQMEGVVRQSLEGWTLA